MVTGFLLSIFPSHFDFFKMSRMAGWHLFLFLKVLLVFVFCRKAYAVEWYATFDSGVLSGNVIKNNGIPSNVPFGFSRSVIQFGRVGFPAQRGTLISVDNQILNTSSDSFVKFTNLGFPQPLFPSLILDDDLVAYNTSGNRCRRMLTAGLLDTNFAYKLTGSGAFSCLSQAFNELPSSGIYNVSGDGLAILFVEGSSNNLNISKPLLPASDRKRLLLIYNSSLSISPSVGINASNANFNSPAQIKAGFYLFGKENSYSLADSVDEKALIFEGVLVGTDSLFVSRNFVNSTFPGGYYKFDPFYVSELSKKGLSGLVINGLLESKITWKYE